MLETESPHPNHQFGAMYTYPAGVISLTDFSASLRFLQKTAFQLARRSITEPQQLKHRPAIELGRILVEELVDMLLYWKQKEEPRNLKQLSQDLEYCTKFWTAFSAYTPGMMSAQTVADVLTEHLLEDYQKLVRLIGSIVQGPTWHVWTVLNFGDNSILVDRGDYRIVQWHLAQELAANKINTQKEVPMPGVMVWGNLTRQEEDSLIHRESVKRLIEDIQRQSMCTANQVIEEDPVTVGTDRPNRTKKK